MISAAGGDEILTDYGNGGEGGPATAAPTSCLKGVFPANLSGVFPWCNFFLGAQRNFLMKEEHVLGAHGLEGRVPFADKAFDCVTCVVSFDYLTQPLEVMREAAEVRALHHRGQRLADEGGEVGHSSRFTRARRRRLLRTEFLW